ncbi:unnamed protein product [Nesidiocoris tenuis]|uniref:SURP motif domain-containing protein n=1 Tax=Nesidiocoris tenuis TaxID=355587 RepID=A0A6H5GTA2_9HEMI|nr:unnamed protein product [Nesidiocoris tenuis]
MATEPDAYEEKRAAFVKTIAQYMANNETVNAFDSLNDLQNAKMFQDSSHELIWTLGKYVTKKVKFENFDSFRCAQQTLERIARECCPQETYLELLEEAEDSDDVKFVTLIEIIKHCLCRMPKQRGKSICWVCDLIVRHLSKMDDVRDGQGDNGSGDFEDDEGILKGDSGFSGNVTLVYEGIVEFFEPLINEVQGGECDVPVDHMEEYKTDMKTCLIKCLGRPLVHVDLSSESEYHSLAHRLVKMINSLVPEPFQLLERVDMSFGCVEFLDDDAVNTAYNNVSLGCYFYLIFEDSATMLTLSHVFSPRYLFECAMAMAFDLMFTNEAPLVYKALRLFDKVLDRLSPNTVAFNSIKDSVLSKFLEMITQNMVHNNVKEVRQLSVSVFPKFLNKFTQDGQYTILFNVNQLSPDPGFTGYAMTLVKERVRFALDSKDPASLKYFTGKKLVDLLLRYCRITGLVESDLHLHTDLIVTCLNLIRYLLIRDRNNEAELAGYLSTVDETYIEPVKKACAFARGLYEGYKAEPVDIHVNVLGSGNVLPEMSPAEQRQMMNDNLLRVDMIESLACRVSECLVEYKENRQVAAVAEFDGAIRPIVELCRAAMRGNSDDQEKAELLVFGYACKLFRDDDRASAIDSGAHLIPWMGDDSLRIDRYDGRGALYDLAAHEPKEFYPLDESGEEEKALEQLCDEERYRSLYINEEEELTYKEEEAKRQYQQTLNYGEVAYSYDAAASNPTTEEQPPQAEVALTTGSRPFVPSAELQLPPDMDAPKTVKHNAIIERTALFLAQQGSQMEILMKVKQQGNKNFDFLSHQDPLHRYYLHLKQLIKSGTYVPREQDLTEEETPEESAEDSYLHPSLIAAKNTGSASNTPPPPSALVVEEKPKAPKPPPTDHNAPPDYVQKIIEVMVKFVIRNGIRFEAAILKRNDVRFSFLNPKNPYNAFYKLQLDIKQKQYESKSQHSSTKENNPEGNSVGAKPGLKRKPLPVCFSIKKPKESEGLDAPSALLLEESSEDEDCGSSTPPKQAKMADPEPELLSATLEKQLKKMSAETAKKSKGKIESALLSA